MDTNRIKALIESGFPEAEVHVLSDDGVHFQAIVVSAAFEGKSLIERHRMVKNQLKEHFDSGALHALGLRTLTPEQWAREQNG